MLPGEQVTRAIYVRRPVHRLLRYVYRAGKYLGARGSEQKAIAGLAASEHCGPAVDLRGLDPRVDLGCDKRQPKTDEEALNHVITHIS